MKAITIALLLVLLSAGLSGAATVTYNWTAVATDTDGNLLTSDGLTITAYKLYCGTTVGGENSTPVYSGLALTASVTGPGGTDIYCYATATASNGVSSDISNEVKKTFPAAKPSKTILSFLRNAVSIVSI